MAPDNIRVLIVDDSAVIRAMISDRVASASGMSVAGTARNGREALSAIATLKPDVVTLDLQMPGMDGLAVLDSILDNDLVPIIMVSAVTRAGAAITLEALDRGAADYIAKPAYGTDGAAIFASDLVCKIRSVAGMHMRQMLLRRKHRARRAAGQAKPIEKPTADLCPAELAGQCVALGISTGGPPALSGLLESLRPPMPPIVIVQHMPPQFTGPLASRLDAISALSVREATHGERLVPNCVYIAPGGRHLELRRSGTHVSTVLHDGPPENRFRPSIDVMMTSAAKVLGPNCLGVIMTGMGRDGVAGCRAIREAGGFVLGQDEGSSDVYGMNRAAYVEGHVDRQFSLSDAAVTLWRQVRRLGCEVVAS